MARILGIDPGLRVTGYAVVDIAAGRLEPDLVEAGVLRLTVNQPISPRLAELHQSLTELIEQHAPGCLAVEKLYAHYNHPRTAIQMGHARGVILLCAAQRGLTTHDLPATAVKKSLTGYGHASKQQMQRAVASQCGLDQPPSPPDVADAIAIALCHGRRVALGRMGEARAWGVGIRDSEKVD